MAKKNENRANITLKCPKCGELNYRVEKNKVNSPERMEINKFCRSTAKFLNDQQTKTGQQNNITDPPEQHISLTKPFPDMDSVLM